MEKITLNFSINSFEFHGFAHFNDALTAHFKAMYINFYATDNVVIPEALLDDAKTYFNSLNDQELLAISDDFYNNFTYISEELLKTGRFDLAWKYWWTLIKFTRDYEQSVSRNLHKGTLYYFASVACLLKGDIDLGLVHMHLALEEDKKNNTGWFDAPAMALVRLNNQSINQYFKQYVDEMFNFIDKRLQKYNSDVSASFTENTLRQKFLDNVSLSEDIRYTFTYCLIRIWHLRKLHKNKINDGILASLIFGHTIFQFLLVIDDVFKQSTGKSNYSGHLDYVNSMENWHVRNYIQDLDVNNRRNIDFDEWLDSILENRYTTVSGRIVNSKLEEALILTYGLRNMQAHELSSNKKLWDNFTEIFKLISYAFFKSCDLLP